MKRITFTDAITLDRLQKEANKEKARATAKRANEWEKAGYRKASACITIVNADPILLANKMARIAKKNAIIEAQKALFEEMVKAFDLEGMDGLQ